MARKRLRAFLRAVPKVLAHDDPEAVRRARVASRRVEAYLSALLPKPYSRKLRKACRALKRVRRALGRWRDCDVMLALVEKRRARARVEAARAAWKLVEDDIRLERRRAMKRGRRKIQKYDLSGSGAVVQKWLNKSRPALLEKSLDGFAIKWRSALAAAEKGRTDDDLHALRIATKRLRYKFEIAREAGIDAAAIGPLRRLQRLLGNWHDREILEKTIAEALARPKTVLREVRAARMLLGELEIERRHRAAARDGIFRAAAAARRHV